MNPLLESAWGQTTMGGFLSLDALWTLKIITMFNRNNVLWTHNFAIMKDTECTFTSWDLHWKNGVWNTAHKRVFSLNMSNDQFPFFMVLILVTCNQTSLMTRLFKVLSFIPNNTRLMASNCSWNPLASLIIIKIDWYLHADEIRFTGCNGRKDRNLFSRMLFDDVATIFCIDDSPLKVNWINFIIIASFMFISVLWNGWFNGEITNLEVKKLLIPFRTTHWWTAPLAEFALEFNDRVIIGDNNPLVLWLFNSNPNAKFTEGFMFINKESSVFNCDADRIILWIAYTKTSGDDIFGSFTGSDANKVFITNGNGVWGSDSIFPTLQNCTHNRLFGKTQNRQGNWDP